MSKRRSDGIMTARSSSSSSCASALIILFLLTVIAVQSATAEELEIRFGSTSNLGVLPLIAKHEGIFQTQGVDVEYKKFQTGKMTMDALLAGEIEIGTLVDSNIAFINYSQNPIKVVAVIATRLDDAIWYNTKSGISKPSDLVNKRVGYAPATTSHLFLARFLNAHGVSWSAIKPVILQPPAMEAALRSGAVDAVSIWQPWGVNLQNSQELKVGSFYNSADIYPSKILLATTDKVAREKSAAVTKVIQSLVQASEIYKSRSGTTYPYLSTEIGLAPADLPVALNSFDFTVRPGSVAIPLVKEIGLWIKATQQDFLNQQLPLYDHAFDGHFVSLSNESPSPAKLIPVSFCRPNNMVSALSYIAEAKGYFSRHGLAPKFETATNAKICQDIVIARKADYMTGAEGPFTYLAASSPPIKILAMLQQNPETSIFARQDRGISRFEDLKNKRIAYLPGTVSYFFLGRVMKKFGIARSDLKLAPMQPPTMPAALRGGAIDAFSMWEPWGAQAVSQMPGQVINLTAPELYQYEALLTGHSEALKSQPEIPGKILRAFIDAERFITEHGEEAYEILSKAITFEATAFKRLWPSYKHKVRLEGSPLKLMTENFELLKEDDVNFVDSKMPNFKSFVDASFLATIDPSRIEAGF